MSPETIRLLGVIYLSVLLGVGIGWTLRGYWEVQRRERRR